MFPFSQLLQANGVRTYILYVDVSDGTLWDTFSLGIQAGVANRPPTIQPAVLWVCVSNLQQHATVSSHTRYPAASCYSPKVGSLLLLLWGAP